MCLQKFKKAEYLVRWTLMFLEANLKSAYVTSSVHINFMEVTNY